MAAHSDENKRSPLKAWVRALERTAPIEKHPSRTLPALIQELGLRFGDAPALIAQDSTLTYRGLAGAANRYARWGLDLGLGAGDVVCLLMQNCPEYLAIWLGLTHIGVTVALINTNLTGEPLLHSLHTVAPRHVIVSAQTLCGHPCGAGAPEACLLDPRRRQFRPAAARSCQRQSSRRRARAGRVRASATE